MVEKREIVPARYVAAFSLTLLIFILGIWLGNHLAYGKLGQLEQIGQELSILFVSLELKNELLREDLCALDWEYLSNERVEMGNKVTMLERRLGKKNPDVLAQKRVYELIEIRSILLLEEFKKKCNTNLIKILYFYTNKEDDVKGNFATCEQQGYILNMLYREYPSIVNIFSFDINLENPASSTLMKIYGIESAPVLVIDDEVYAGFKKISLLKEIIGLEELEIDQKE